MEELTLQWLVFHFKHINKTKNIKNKLAQMKRIKKLLGLASIATVVFFTSCDKEFDTPPIKELPTGNIITIADLRAMWVTEDVKITDDISLYAVVTMDEQTGNIYKESYIQDATGAINLRLQSSGGLYEGDSVRVYLKGTIVSKYNQMMQLDSVDVDNNIIKQATQHNRTPELISDISQITAAHQAKLIRLENVQFNSAELGQTYADAANQQSMNHMLEDAAGNQIIVRTSGYANFADDTIPSLNGSFIGVVSQYNNDLQLLIRDPNELNFTNARAQIKYFSDQSITSGGWTVQNIVGSVNWTTSDAGSTGNFYGVITNTSSNLICETWYISPSTNLSASTAPFFSFRSATFSSNPDLEIYVSTDYDGVSLPATATWTLLSPILSSGSWSWTSSGNIDLSSYMQPSVYVAFKYTGTGSAWTTWEIDDLNIKN
jgi:hypothetical protein